MNTKRYLIKPSVRSFPVQATTVVRSAGTQYDIEDILEEAHTNNILAKEDEEHENDTEYVADKNDRDYVPSESDEEADSDEELDDKEVRSREFLSDGEPNKERQSLVAESCPLSLLGERGGSVVECRTPEREVRGSRPTAAVLCP